MATFANQLQQSTSEIHTYTIDYTNDLPSGGTVTAGTATHTPPSGSASTVTTSVSSPYIYATLPAQSVTGVHYVDVVATFSDNDTSAVRIPINVVYPSTAARSGMLYLVDELRILTEASANDYSIGGTPFWTDVQLQNILDQHRDDIIFQQLDIYPVQIAGGSLSYQDYRTPYNWLEETTGGTSILYIQDGTGTTIGTANYTADVRRGQFQFSSDQGGSTYYLTGRTYDINAAAADVWRRKAAHYAPTSFDFSTDNHSIKRSAVYDHCIHMAEYFENQGGQSIESVMMYRSDM